MRDRRRVVNPKDSVFASKKAIAQNHLKMSCDINEIVAKARRGIPPVNYRGPGQFLDVSDSPQTLMEAFEKVGQAMDSFNALPALARQELDNDPRRLLEANREFLERHGMLVPQAPQAGKPEGQETEGGRPSDTSSKKKVNSSSIDESSQA